jgi:hypothetical protein
VLVVEPEVVPGLRLAAVSWRMRCLRASSAFSARFRQVASRSSSWGGEHLDAVLSVLGECCRDCGLGVGVAVKEAAGHACPAGDGGR